MSSRGSTRRRTAKLYTIGSSGKSAETFFTLIMDAGVRRIIDVRLNNNSALLGFTRQAHLPYLLKEIAQIDYVHKPMLAPDDGILGDWKLNAKAKEAGKKQITWQEYETRFKQLLHERKIETLVKPSYLHQACLLCSEVTAEQCHRRLVAEYLRGKWAGRVKVEIVHL